MDLTSLLYYLVISGTTTQIDEPVDFDSLKLTMKRDPDYHGISAEFSESTLTFYGVAATLIQTAYNTSIDSDITFRALSGTTVFYEGKLDLSTYQEKDGAYFAVTCKVGEISVKTTFNNRVETEVDINGAKTISGVNLAHNPTWKTLDIPARTIHHSNDLTTTDVVMIESKVPSGRFHLPANQSHHFIAINLTDQTTLNEFGVFNTGYADIADQITPQTVLANELIDDYYQPIFSRETMDEWHKKYGKNATYDIDIDLTVKLAFETADLFPTSQSGASYTTYYNGQYLAALTLLAPLSTFGSPVILARQTGSLSNITITNQNASQTFTMRIQSHIQGIALSRLTLGFYLINNTTYYTSVDPAAKRINLNKRVNVIARTMPNGYVRMTLNSKINDSAKASVLPVHEALNKVVETISDNALNVKSDYYGRFDSIVNPLPTTTQTPIVFGDGALKMLTTGYKLRNADPSGAKFNTAISFKDFTESLDAIDCIGWGFTTESGQTCLRVERWDYFYNNNLVLTITDPNKLTRSLDIDRIITELTIGYKKYANSDEINSLDAVHSEHTYTNQCKTLTKQRSRLCGFIADNYAIEETRRKQFDNDTTDFKYDENFFIFEAAYLTLPPSRQYQYMIPSGNISDATELNDSSEWYNMRITPHRNASRWQKYLKWAILNNEFSFISGKMNTKAEFSNEPPTTYPLEGYMLNYEIDMNDAEASDLMTQQITTPIKKEIVSITYPLTLAQYQSLRANPYGLIRVDGVDYWLQEASYELKTGKTDLKLIPKHN